MSKFNTELQGGAPELFEDGWEMGHFQEMDLVGDGVGGVLGGEGGRELGDDLAAVAHGRDIMNGDAGFGFAGGLDGFVDVVTPHAFAAVLGQQGGMDVDDAAGKGFDEEVGH